MEKQKQKHTIPLKKKQYSKTPPLFLHFDIIHLLLSFH